MDRNGNMTREMSTLVDVSGYDETTVRKVLRALASLVRANDRSEIRGLGVFTWRPFHGHLPNGEPFSTERLYFTSQCIKRNRRKRGK